VLSRQRRDEQFLNPLQHTGMITSIFNVLPRLLTRFQFVPLQKKIQFVFVCDMQRSKNRC
jgi:hypothetical protein